VPDGDTGTNRSLTLDAVQKEIDEAAGAVPGDLDMATLATCLSHGSLMGARGNSGVILSQVLRGMASAFRDGAGRSRAGPGETDPLPGDPLPGDPLPGDLGPGDLGPGDLGPGDLAEAFSRASDSAYTAVSNPVEGTILTVARAAARGAEAAMTAPGHALVAVLDAARQAAALALAGTTEQLPALKSAGVVDAGGAGLLLLIDSFLHVVDGRDVPAPPTPARQPGAGHSGAGHPSAGRSSAGYPAATDATGEAGAAGAAPADRAVTRLAHPGGAGAGDVGDLRYEVMFFLEAPDEAVAAFRQVWAGVGGSVVIVGGDGLYNCHIHTDDIGGAIEAAIEIGRPRQIRVTDLAEQVEEERWVREAEASGDQGDLPVEPVTCAVVAVCAGEGVKRIFRSLGARQIVTGGQSANPSTAQILDAITAAEAEQVVVLPNNPNVVPVAEQAADHARQKVRVVPTTSIPEGFAALLAYDPEADVDTNADNMAAAADRVLAGEVARASRDAVTDAGPVRAGDWLGLSRHGVKVVTAAPATVSDAVVGLLDALLAEADDPEIVTVIEGEGAHAADTRRIVEWLSDRRPEVTVEVHHGGQPLYPYLLSIE
jgi:DAK2 domain fusion protein YloV